MNTRSRGAYIPGFYFEQLTRQDELTTEHSYSKAFCKLLNNSIIRSLKYKKNKRNMVKEKFQIPESFFYFLKRRYNVNCRYKCNEQFLSTTQIESMRFYRDGSSSNLILNSFEIKVSSKKPDRYYDKHLNLKSTKAEFFFNYKYFKEEKTAFMNNFTK